MTKTHLETIYATLLAVPGMHDPLKIDLKIPRRTVLLLTEVLRKGMESNMRTAPSFSLASNLSTDAKSELNTIIHDSLEKAGLIDLSTKLREIAEHT